MRLTEWVIVLCFCCITLSEGRQSRCRSDIDLDKIWTLFKKEYQKRYCRSEDCKRRRIFDKAVARVFQHNLEFDLGHHTYRKGLNKNSDLTLEEILSKGNGFQGTPESRRNRSTRRRMFPEMFSSTSNPKKLDYRDQDLVTRVKDQTDCGSCYAFSALASLESQTIKATNRTVLLSEQNIVDCSSDYGNNGCQGGLMTHTFEYIINNGGVNTEKSYPYEAKEGQCRFRESNIGATCSDYDEINNGNERDLLDALVKVGPIAVGLDASLESFQDYKGGIYDDPECNSENLNHAILLIGYGTEDGVDYWLVKNSYGTSWGENGFGKMVRNKDNQCGLATQASYPIVKT